MKHYHLILTSKTEKSLYNLLHFLKNRYLDLNIIKKDFKRKKKSFTPSWNLKHLKSPFKKEIK